MKKQYYQNEDGDIICYTGKTPSKEDRTIVAEELHSGESKLKTINGQSLIGEGDIAVAAPVARTLKLDIEGMTDDGIWKLSECVALGQLGVVDYAGTPCYPVFDCPYIFTNIVEMSEPTSENSMIIASVIVLGNIAFEVQTSFSFEVDAETGDSRMVVEEVNLSPETIGYFSRLNGFAADRSWPEPDENGWVPDRSLISIAGQADLQHYFWSLRSMLEGLDAEYVKKLIGGPVETEMEE